jgi:hypothetical protein
MSNGSPMALAPTLAASASRGTNQVFFWIWTRRKKTTQGDAVGDRGGGENDYAAYKCRE